MLYFVGAALIAGARAVVHYPIDPPVYTVICVVGALVFLLGTVVNEFVFAAERPTLAVRSRSRHILAAPVVRRRAARRWNPALRAVPRALGGDDSDAPVLMSFAAFVAEDAEGRWRNMVSAFGATVVLVAGATWFGTVPALADSLETSDHRHGSSSVFPADEKPQSRRRPTTLSPRPRARQHRPRTATTRTVTEAGRIRAVSVRRPEAAGFGSCPLPGLLVD